MRARSVAARAVGRAQHCVQRLILEQRYGMPSDVLRDVDSHEVGLSGADWQYPYAASPWGILRRVLHRSDVSNEDVFIDFGCGMGVVLVEAAARYSFRRVIGVDIAPQFTRVAREIVDRNRGRLRCRHIEVVTANAADYEVPDDVTVAYFFDPFREEVLDAAIENLIASVDRNPRRLRVILFSLLQVSRFERTGRVRLVRHGRRRMRRWAAAGDLAMYEIEPSVAPRGAPEAHSSSAGETPRNSDRDPSSSARYGMLAGVRPDSGQAGRFFGR